MIWPDDARDFVLNPDLVAEEKYAVRSALVFWKNNGLEKIAVKGITCTEVDKITARVNEGTDTYTARCNNLKTIMKLPFFKECDPLKDIRP
jgi:predicted chitinase